MREMGRKRGNLENEERPNVGLTERVLFLGFVNLGRNFLPFIARQICSSCHRCLNRLDWVVNEAMLCGLPVVVSDRVGAKFDLVRPGRKRRLCISCRRRGSVGHNSPGNSAGSGKEGANERSCAAPHGVMVATRVYGQHCASRPIVERKRCGFLSLTLSMILERHDCLRKYDFQNAHPSIWTQSGVSRPLP